MSDVLSGLIDVNDPNSVKPIETGEKIVAFIFLIVGAALCALSPVIFLLIVKKVSIWMILMIAVGVILILLSLCGFVAFADEAARLAAIKKRDAALAAAKAAEEK